MTDYSKYSDKTILAKPLKTMTAAERELFELTAESKAEKIIDELKGNKQLFHDVSMKLAKHALSENTNEEEGDNVI